MELFFDVETELARQRRENFRDQESRLVIVGDGKGGNPANIYADGNRLWVRDIGGSNTTGSNTPGLAYRVLAGSGYTPDVDVHLWVRWEGALKQYRVHMIDPGFLAERGGALHLENANDRHNQFRRTEMLLPLRSQLVGLGLANVQGYQFIYNGKYGDYKGTSGALATHVNLIALQPATVGMKCYALLTFNPVRFFAALNPIQTYTSTPQTGDLNGSDIQECVDQIGSNQEMIHAYRLDAGATEYRGQSDDRDVRGWLNQRGNISDVSPLTTKGDLFTYSTLNTRLPVGANGTVLTVDSSAITGLTYATVGTNGLTDASITIPKFSPLALKTTTTAPTINDDSGDGYAIGSRWIDTVTDKEYVLVDTTVGAAVWVVTTGGKFATIATATDPGIQGQWCFNATHVFFCTAVNTWVRVSTATW